MYELRIGLALLDWNEHVDRLATSIRNPVCVNNPRRRAPKRVLTPKTNQFVKTLWDKFTSLWTQNNHINHPYQAVRNICL